MGANRWFSERNGPNARVPASGRESLRHHRRYSRPLARPAPTSTISVATVRSTQRSVTFQQAFARVGSGKSAERGHRHGEPGVAVQRLGLSPARRDRRPAAGSRRPPPRTRHWCPYASLDSPALTRNADRNAPWLPDSPPKKPEINPPTASQRGENASRANVGESSSSAKAAITTPMTALTGVDRVGPAQPFVDVPRRQAQHGGERAGAQHGGQRGGQAEAHHHGPAGVAAHQPDLEQVVGQVHHGRHGHGGGDRKKSAKTGVRIVPSPKPERQRQAGRRSAR